MAQGRQRRDVGRNHMLPHHKKKGKKILPKEWLSQGSPSSSKGVLEGIIKL
ncbi:hypothetical protein SESBI_20475 [Sesbania bispinosa]|nr:hypothetical protein SESBI_20475 [Sesbania bispinosa]